MLPDRLAGRRIEREQLAVGGGHQHPPAGHGRRRADRRPDLAPPHLAAAGRIQPVDHAVAGDDEQLAVVIGGGTAGEAVDLLDVLGVELPDLARRSRRRRRVVMPSASTANTRPPATTGPASSREPPPAPAPMPERQATSIVSAASRCCMACVGSPPACGQSALRTGGGRTTLSWARRGSALSWSSISSTALRSPGSGGAGVSPSQVPSPQPARRAAAAVSAPRRESPLTSSPGRARPRSPAAARPRAAAARAARRPPCSARPGCSRASSRAPARIATSARSSRAWLRQGAPAAASGSSCCVSVAGSPVSSCCSTASRVPRSRRIGSLRAAGGEAVQRRQRPGRVLLAELGLGLLEPGERGEAGLALGRQGRELGGRLGMVARLQGLLGGGEAGGLGRARLRRPMVPADLGGGAGHDQHGQRPGPWRRSAATAWRAGRGAAPRRPRG